MHSHLEIGCVDPKIVESMVIFTIEHVSWNLKSISVPRVHILKIIDLLKEKVATGILEHQMFCTQIGGYSSNKERVTMVHLGLATDEQGHNPECQDRTNSR